MKADEPLLEGQPIMLALNASSSKSALWPNLAQLPLSADEPATSGIER
jgi:hypothetical protein